MAPQFSGLDQNGNVIDLSKIIVEKPVVLIFYRGQWCPVCMPYLNSFQDSLAQIEANGATVIAISPEKTENIQSTIFKTKITLSVLSDTTNKIMQEYGVFFYTTDAYNKKISTKLNTNIAENNAQKRAALPVPATYIIDKSGKISWRQFNINYRMRASVKEILSNLPK